MGKVQAIIEEVSRSQDFENGYYVSLHYVNKTRYSDVTRFFCKRNHEIKTDSEVRELIDNMSLNECRGQCEEEVTPKKKGMIDLKNQGVLLASNKLLNIQLETLAKRLEAREVAQLSVKAYCNVCEQTHESDACLRESLGVLKDQVRYMGNYSRQ
jgi:hypothetical protein